MDKIEVGTDNDDNQKIQKTRFHVAIVNRMRLAKCRKCFSYLKDHRLYCVYKWLTLPRSRLFSRSKSVESDIPPCTTKTRLFTIVPNGSHRYISSISFNNRSALCCFHNGIQTKWRKQTNKIYFANSHI